MRQLLATLFAIGLAAGCSNPIETPPMEDAGIVSDAAPMADSQIYYGQCDWRSRPSPVPIQTPQDGPCTLRVVADDLGATVHWESENFEAHTFELDRSVELKFEGSGTLRYPNGEAVGVHLDLYMGPDGVVFGIDAGDFFMTFEAA